MPRKPRMYLPGVPCHVIQRGNNRQASFFSAADQVFYLECLQDAARRYGVAVHAYVLMTNHVHLLATPVEADSISRTMQSIGRRYVQYVNLNYRRTGTLWESRHKASLVDAEGYLLHCMRYIELNPVRAGMVPRPADYRWSSYRANVQQERNDLITRHEIYNALGLDDEARAQAYRELFSTALNSNQVRLIRQSAAFSMPTGDDRFRAQVEAASGRKIARSVRGRQSKDAPNCE